MRVFIYWNLHRRIWSVRALEGSRKGLVVAHTGGLVLEDCLFKVSEAGRQRVLREKRKNVHAGVAGHLVAIDGEALAHELDVLDLTNACITECDTPVTYNPYRYPLFHIPGTAVAVLSAEQATLGPHTVAAAGAVTEAMEIAATLEMFPETGAR